MEYPKVLFKKELKIHNDFVEIFHSLYLYLNTR